MPSKGQGGHHSQPIRKVDDGPCSHYRIPAAAHSRESRSKESRRFPLNNDDHQLAADRLWVLPATSEDVGESQPTACRLVASTPCTRQFASVPALLFRLLFGVLG
jgi:hypothetical protein